MPALIRQLQAAVTTSAKAATAAAAAAAVATAATLALGAGNCLAQAASAPAAAGAEAPAAPTSFGAPAEPKPDDSAAQRNKSQPGNNAPFWRAVRNSGTQEGVVNLPGAEKGVLIQQFVQVPGMRSTNAGEAWRQVRNRWILPYGGALLLVALVALGIFYWKRGALGHADGTGKPVIQRFTPFERAAHWTNASAFVALAVSGTVMAFGKFFLLPVIGGTLFGLLTYALKTLHNFVGPLFAVSLLVVLATFVKDNIANAADFVWLSKAGGLLGDKQVPSHRFNSAEKGMFWWGMGVPGLLIVLSGLTLDKLLPGLGALRGDMQISHVVHATAAVWTMAVVIGHIYMGTVGVKGAYRAMRSGWVDADWAREHHELWYKDVQAGKIPAQRAPEAQNAPAAAPPKASHA